jgi:hypothetical protein
MALDLGTIFVKIGAKNDELMKALSKSEQALEKFSSKMEGIGRTHSLRITAPLAAIGYKATQMAGEVVESENLFSVAMGKMETAGRKFTNAYAKSLGLNEYEMRRQMGTFKVMAESMRLPEKASYELAEGFTKLAYDLASFYNISFDSAFEKLRSGMVGMVMPLRELGINITETAVESYALRNGLIKQGETLSEQGKVLARYGAIMEQTKLAQGNLARELDNPASKFRALQEQTKALTKEFGDALLPVFSKLLSMAMEATKKLRDLTDAFKKLSPEVQETWIKVGIFVALLGPASLLIGGITKTIGSLVSVAKGLNVAFGAIVAFGSKVNFAFKAMRGGAATFGEAIAFVLGPIGMFIAALGVVYALYKVIDSLTYKVFNGDALDAKVNDWLAQINFLGKGDMYAKAAEDARARLNAKKNGEEVKDDLLSIGEEVSAVFNDIFKGLDFGIFTQGTAEAKKSVNDIYNTLQKRLSENELAAQNMGKAFNKLAEDAAAYESALFEMFENGIDPSKNDLGQKIVANWRLVLQEIKDTTRADLLATYSFFGIAISKVSDGIQTLSDQSFSLGIEEALLLPDEQFAEFISSVGLAEKAIKDLDSSFSLGLIDAEEMWSGYQGVFKTLTQNLVSVYSTLEGPAKEAVGELLKYINEQSLSLDATINLANRNQFEEELRASINTAIKSSISIDFETGKQTSNPRNALKIYSDALSKYLAAGHSDSSPFALELQKKINEAQAQVGELDFSDALNKIEQQLDDSLAQSVLAERLTESFDILSYQADLYQKAILEKQSLLLQAGKSIPEVLQATAKWADELKNLNQQIDAAAKKKRIDDIKQAYTQATDATLLSVEEQISSAMGEAFDPKKLKIDALKNAIRATTQEMLQQGKAEEEVLSAIKEWVVELQKLKPDTFKEWTKSLKQDALGQFPIANKAFSMGKNASEAFASVGGSAAMGGAVGAFIALVSESETFKQILNVINPILQNVSDSLGSLLEPLLPLTVVLSETLTPVFEALGVVLSGVFEPALAALFQPLKLLGLVVLGVVSILNWGQLNITKMIAEGFKWLASLPLIGRSFRSLAEASAAKVAELTGKQTDLGQAMEDLINLSYEEAKAKAKLSETAKQASEALRNVPSGFKIALRRYQVADPRAGSYQPTAQTPTIVNFNAPIFGMDDFEREVKGIFRNASRNNSLATNGI